VTTDNLLRILSDRGLRVVVGPGGEPSLVGDRAGASAKLLRVLRLPDHRDEIVRRFRPRPVRRVVLLEGDERSGVEAVLWESTARESSPQRGALRRLAAERPGRVVAAEWLEQTKAGEGWRRYLWMKWPEDPGADGA
jgi:hypothetical protein